MQLYSCHLPVPVPHLHEQSASQLPVCSRCQMWRCPAGGSCTMPVAQTSLFCRCIASRWKNLTGLAEYPKTSRRRARGAKLLTKGVLGRGSRCCNVQSRPFGVALLVAGWQEGSGPVLYHTDPSGMFVEHDAKAIGSGSEGATTTLQVSTLWHSPLQPFCLPLHPNIRRNGFGNQVPAGYWLSANGYR